MDVLKPNIMKHTFLLVAFFSFIIFFDCNSKDDAGNLEIEYLDLDFTINQNETLEISLGAFQSEGSINITKQVENYEVSEITFNEFGHIYNYKPSSNFSGTEYVEITKSSSIGDNNVNQKTIFRINITVTTD